MDAELTARTGPDKKINLCLDRTSENITRVRIRIGLVGDENLSRVILDKIKSNL